MYLKFWSSLALKVAFKGYVYLYIYILYMSMYRERERNKNNNIEFVGSEKRRLTQKTGHWLCFSAGKKTRALDQHGARTLCSNKPYNATSPSCN